VGRVHRFARQRAGDESPFPLQEVAAGAVDLVRHASAARNVELVESYPAVPALVVGDPRRLAQIFVNLLLNALQALPEGGTVTTAVEREGDEIVALVADDGPGIPPGDVERLFELWTTTRAGSGSGLGLAVSRTVAELHGGTLTVHPAAARGARLVLRLPAAPA
jgi:signal transduction histidine kinase